MSNVYSRVEHGTVKSAELNKGGDTWYITSEAGTGFSIARERVDRTIWDDLKPKPGDTISLYCRNGSFVVGVDLNGKRVFLYTQEEWDAESAFEEARSERQKAERFECQRAALDADYEALPQVFRDRIDRFRTNNPTFRQDYESYELFVCKEAVVLAEKAREAVSSGEYDDEVEAFWADPGKLRLAGYETTPDSPELRWLFWAVALNSKAYDYDYEREKAVTGISDGHSGNTYGAAVSLARLYIESPEHVSRMHGSLSPLVGSKEYGDIAVEA